MAFVAKYIPTTDGQPYFRTVYSDSINEATKIAERWRKKGYQLATVTEAE